MNKQRGFTLLELMVTVAMIAIVAAMALPSWRKFVANRRTAGASRAMYNVLQHVRMKAIKEVQPITVVYYDDAGMPVAGASGAAPEFFRKVFICWDENGDGALESREIFNAPDNVLCDTNQDFMTYNPRGILLAANSGTVRAWSLLTNREYSVVVNTLGILRQASGVHSGASP